MRIELRSDTFTMPTNPMMEAMMSAPLGDDVFGEDPTVNALEEKAAAMFGKEAAIFCTSGTMTNQIGIKVHTQPGHEVICEKYSHVYYYEGGGIAYNSGASVRLIDGNRGQITAQQVSENINPDNIHHPITSLVSLENTCNKGGGSYYSLNQIEEIAAICQKGGLKLHLDGARLFNALVETKDDYKKFASNFDTISICLSKGLGAPVGSLLLGNKEQIKKARRIRKVMGGGWRQAGLLAAAGIYALDNNIDRLKDDHNRAKAIELALKQIPYVENVLPVDTNILVFKLIDAVPADQFLKKLAEHDVHAVSFGPQLIRMVTHLNFDDTMLEKLLQILKNI